MIADRDFGGINDVWATCVLKNVGNIFLKVVPDPEDDGNPLCTYHITLGFAGWSAMVQTLEVLTCPHSGVRYAKFDPEDCGPRWMDIPAAPSAPPHAHTPSQRQ